MKSNKSQKKTQSQRSSVMNKSQVYTEDEIDEMIADITLKRGRNPYNIFITEIYKKESEKDANIKLIDIVKKYSSKWKTMTEKEKEKYQKKSDEEREKFKKDVEFVKRYLITYYVKEGATAYRLFLEDRLKAAFENDEDPKEVKIAASKAWKEMSNEKRKEWREKKKENDDWWSKARHSNRINAFAVFVQKKIEEYNKKDEVIDFKGCGKLWAKTSDKDRKKYAKFAAEMNADRAKQREIYEIANGIKPKRPQGAFGIYISELAKEGKFQGKNAFKEGRKMWDKLSEEEKEKYLKLNHRVKICYRYKMMVYKNRIKKLQPTKPKTAYNFFVRAMRKAKIPEGKTFLEYCYEQWDKLDDKGREKYDEMAEKEKKKFAKDRDQIERRVYNPPKKALSAYNIYMKERVTELKMDKPEEQISTLFGLAAKEWNELDARRRKKYEKMANKETDNYALQLKEFEDNGYYIDKTKTQADSQSKSQSQKKRTQRSQSSKKKK